MVKFVDRRGLDNVEGVRHDFVLKGTKEEIRELIKNLGDIIDFDIDIIYENPKYKNDELSEMLEDNIEYDNIGYGLGR